MVATLLSALAELAHPILDFAADFPISEFYTLPSPWLVSSPGLLPLKCDIRGHTCPNLVQYADKPRSDVIVAGGTR